MFSYFWNVELHLAVLALAFESFAGVVELAIAIWLAAVRKEEQTAEVEHRKETLENAFSIIAAVFFIVAVAATWRIVVLQSAHEKDVEAQKEKIAKIDPLNQPVSDISAFVKLKVAGETFPDPRSLGPPSRYGVATMMLCDSNINWSRFNVLVAKDYIPDTNNNAPNTRAYLVHLHSSELGAMYMINSQLPVAKSIEDVKLLRIDTWFLPHDAIVLGGSVAIIVNAGLRNIFQIPPQRDFNPLNNTMGDGFIMFATNAPSDSFMHPPEK